MILRKTSIDAAKGDHRARELFYTLNKWARESKEAQKREALEGILAYKKRAEQELEDRKRTGRRGPAVVPHPRDIVFDPDLGDVVFRGPRTIEEKKIYDDLMEQRAAQIEVCGRLSQRRSRAPNNPTLKAEFERALQRLEVVSHELLDRGWDPVSRSKGDQNDPTLDCGQDQAPNRKTSATGSHRRGTVRLKGRTRTKKPPL